MSCAWPPEESRVRIWYSIKLVVVKRDMKEVPPERSLQEVSREANGLLIAVVDELL
jgi:hypothetical protein